MVTKETLTKRLARYVSFRLVDLSSIILPAIFPIRKRLSFSGNNILVIELAMLGDMLLTTPLLAGIKTCFPDSRVTVLCTPWSKEAIVHNPNVDEIVTYETFWEDRNTNAKPTLKHFISTINLLRYFRRDNNFDIAFVVSSREQPFVMLIGYLSGAAIRVGMKYPSGYRFLTHAVNEAGAHLVEIKRRLLKSVCVDGGGNDQIDYNIMEESRERAKEYLREVFGSEDVPLICVTPSTQQVEKRWKIEFWANLIDRLNGEGLRVLLAGGKGDASYVNSIAKRIQDPELCKNATGELSLNQFAAVLEKSIGIVTVDSAPMHLAAALNLPCLVLFSGVYHPDRLKPRHPSARIMVKEMNCRYCMKGCKDPICMCFSVEEVYQETMRMTELRTEVAY